MLRIILLMVKNLEKIAKQKKIKYFLVTFVDLFGVQRAKLVPTRAIGEMQKTGAGCGGFATHLDLSFSEPDMFALPDPNSLIQLPWQPDVGWLASDLVMNNQFMDQCPRVILKNQINNLDKLNLKMMTGVECEFFILNEDGTEVADYRDDALKPCYDVAASSNWLIRTDISFTKLNQGYFFLSYSSFVVQLFDFSGSNADTSKVGVFQTSNT